MVTVETICVVDVRENNPEAIETPYELQTVENQHFKTAADFQNPNFNPTRMLEPTGAPPKGFASTPIEDRDRTKKRGLGKANGNKGKGGVDMSRADPVDPADTKRAKAKVRLFPPFFSLLCSSPFCSFALLLLCLPPPPILPYSHTHPPCPRTPLSCTRNA
jgi:hypothetical protein